MTAVGEVNTGERARGHEDLQPQRFGEHLAGWKVQQDLADLVGDCRVTVGEAEQLRSLVFARC